MDRLNLITPILTDAVTAAQAELSFAVGEDLTASLAGKVSAAELTDALGKDQSSIARAISGMAQNCGGSMNAAISAVVLDFLRAAP